jgi:hypothetical protein
MSLPQSKALCQIPARKEVERAERERERERERVV